jgi:hypothetical protein
MCAGNTADTAFKADPRFGLAFTALFIYDHLP